MEWKFDRLFFNRLNAFPRHFAEGWRIKVVVKFRRDLVYCCSTAGDCITQSGMSNVEMGLFRQRKSRIKSISETDFTNSIETINSVERPTCRGYHIDFVLTYRKQNARQHEVRRRFYQQNMVSEGFELQFREVLQYKDSLCFVLIHVPNAVVLRYADVWRIKLPVFMEKDFMPKEAHEGNSFHQKRLKLYENVLFSDKWHFSDRKRHFLWPYRREYHNWFLLDSKNCCLNEAQRQAIIWNIMQSIPNDPENRKRKGMDLLLKMKVYENAYPIHDHEPDGPIEILKDKLTDRQVLNKFWASHKCVFRKQPLHVICRYFGHKVGFYFAFMGFYTRMLIPAAIVGVLNTLYGICNIGREGVASEICDASTVPGNLTMCPICLPPNCKIWQLAQEGCSRTKTSYVMDNEATLFMSCFVIAWAALLLKLWKRREASLAFEWGTDELGESTEIIRPDYIARATEKRLDKVTMEYEDYIPLRIRLGYFLISFLTTVSLLLSSSMALIGLSLLRVMLYGEFQKFGGIFDHHSIEFARWTVHGFIFVVVFIFGKIYHTICHRLTTMERPRTEKEYWFRFLWKLFVFELFNEFTPIFYAAFFKEITVGTPLDLRFYSELCDPGGCTSEVTELIAVLLMARLVLKNFLAAGMDGIHRILSHCRLTYSRMRSETVEKPQWQKDFEMEELEYDGVAEEFMEMVVQFAFCTLFVAAFPLAPLICLINNVMELRRDAKKMMNHRRPVPMRVCGIEIWNTFFDCIVHLSVLTNAAFISFSSDLFPKMYYKENYSPNYSYVGFADYSMSKVYTEKWIPLSDTYKNVTECWYKGYRLGEPPYDVTSRYWEILAVRVSGFTLFICIFYLSTFLIGKMISDKPMWVKIRVERTKYLARKVFY